MCTLTSALTWVKRRNLIRGFAEFRQEMRHRNVPDFGFVTFLRAFPGKNYYKKWEKKCTFFREKKCTFFPFFQFFPFLYFNFSHFFQKQKCFKLKYFRDAGTYLRTPSDSDRDWQCDWPPKNLLGKIYWEKFYWEKFIGKNLMGKFFPGKKMGKKMGKIAKMGKNV